MAGNKHGNDKTKDLERKLPPIKLSSFVDPRGPWVLVPDGSLMNFFDWVPKHFRVGAWSVVAAPTLLILTALMIYLRPTEDTYFANVSHYPDAYSTFWWCNLLGFALMLGVAINILVFRLPGAVASFTLLSWLMNMSRHGINALAPFLSDHHPLLKLNHILRFPALVSASVTFTVWNFVLVPYILIFVHKKSETRRDFVIWNFSWRLVQLHVCNMIYSIMNTVVAGSKSGPHLFDKEDLWYGGAYGLSYGLFYTLILDRIGVHLYPIFTPRSNYFVLTWMGGFSVFYASFCFWNHYMTHYWELINVSICLRLNFSLIGICAVIHRLLEKKEKV